jgi:hypothetical protein
MVPLVPDLRPISSATQQQPTKKLRKKRFLDTTPL